MNTDENTVPDRDELERITAPTSSMKLASDESTDPELRQTWLALGTLLDRNIPSDVEVDEARIRAALLGPPEEHFHWGRAALWAGLALAASVVFAFWIMHGIMAKDQSTRQEYVVTPDRSTSKPTTHHSPRPAVVEVAWDDRIAQVRSSVRQLQNSAVSVSTQPPRHDEKVDQLRSRINKFQRAWGANQL